MSSRMITRFSLFEGVRDRMTPKSEEDVMKSFLTADPEDILQHSFENKFIKGIKYVLDNYRLYGRETKSIITNYITRITNKEDMEYLLGQEQIVKFLSQDQLYILEKYVLGLHQKEEKDYERCLRELLDRTDYYQSVDNPDVMIGQNKKHDKNYFNYNKKTKVLTHHLDNMRAWIACKNDDDNYESHRGDNYVRGTDLGWGYDDLVMIGVLEKYYGIEIDSETGSRNDSYSFVKQ